MAANKQRTDQKGKSSRVVRQLVLLLVVAGAIATLPGCGEKLKIEGDPKTIVYENVKAMENEDLERAMATVDDQCEAYEQTKQLAKKLFETYDLKYELDSVRVTGQTDTEAKVECLQTTRKVSGPAFRDNKISIVHRLRNTDGIWRIYSTQVLRLDYLN
jgi:hypothetical protein